MATYPNNKKGSVQLDTNRKRYALVAGNGIAILMSDEHKYRRFDAHPKNSIMNSLDALEYILAKCPNSDTITERVIDIGIPNCIKGVFGPSFRQYIRTQKFVGSGEIIPVYMLDKMKAVVRMYNDREFNVNIYSLSMAGIDEEMVKIKQRAIDILYQVQVENAQQPAPATQQPVQGFTQEQVNQMVQSAVAQALASFMQSGQMPVQPTSVQSQPAPQPVVETAPVVAPVSTPVAEQPVAQPAVTQQQPATPVAPESVPTPVEETIDFSAEDFAETTSRVSEDFLNEFDEFDMEEIPF